jgi:hypothetical protein
MDPNATALIMRDTSAKTNERYMAAFDLNEWLRNGGFPQSMFDKDGRHISFGGNTAARFAARQECEQIMRELNDEWLKNLASLS